jgi:sugar phosphate isomerase/epimerase
MSIPTAAAWLDSYPCEFKEGLRAAVADGYRCIAASAIAGTMHPAELSQSGRRHLARHLRDLGLTCVSLGAEFAGAGLADPRHTSERIELLGDVIRLARDLGVADVSYAIGGHDDPQRAEAARQVLAELADISDRTGITLTGISGDGDARLLAEQVRRLGCETMKVGIDAAADRDYDAIAAAAGGCIGAVIARDVRRRGDRWVEVPFGEGEVDFARLLSTLEQSGYAGFLTIRADTESPARSILKGGAAYFAGFARP